MKLSRVLAAGLLVCGLVSGASAASADEPDSTGHPEKLAEIKEHDTITVMLPGNISKIREMVEPEQLVELYSDQFIGIRDVTEKQIAKLSKVPELRHVAKDQTLTNFDTNLRAQVDANLLPSGLNGSGFSVAVLDTGFNVAAPHTNGRYQPNYCFTGASNGCPNGTNAQVGANVASWDYCINDPNLTGCTHGEGAAQIAAASDNEPGMAPGANVIAVRTGVISGTNVLSTTQSLLAALQYIYTNRATFSPPLVAISISAGTGAHTGSNCDNADPTMTTAIDNLWAADIAVVISTGNESQRNASAWPSCISHAVAVSSVYNGALSAYANLSGSVDILAPECALVDYFGTWAYTDMYCGSSASAPLVAGLITALKQHVSSWGMQTRSLVQVVINNPSAVVTDTRSGCACWGRGVINARTAYERLLDMDPINNNTGRITTFRQASRVIDTRNGLGGALGKVGGGQSMRLYLPDFLGISPNDMKGVMLNVTLSGPTGWTAVTAAKTQPTSQPAWSSVFIEPGEAPKSAHVWSPITTSGFLYLYVYAATVDMIVDVQGFVGSSSDFNFLPNPARVINLTTPNAQSYTGPHDIRGTNGIPSNATGVIGSLESTSNADNYVSLVPSNAPAPPSTSNLNMTIPNHWYSTTAAVKFGPDGKFKLWNQAGTTSIVLDAVGYTTGSTVDLKLLTQPVRLIDTRNQPGGVGTGWHLFATAMPSTCPSSYQGVLANQALLSVSQSYASLAHESANTKTPPVYSTINTSANTAVANTASANTLLNGGGVKIYTQTDSDEVLLDLMACFTP